MSRYPHTLTVMQSDESVQDTNGDFNIPDSVDIIGLPCREEPGGGAARLQVVDGVVLEFHSIIYLPNDTPDIPNGLGCVVEGAEGERMRGVIKRFVRDRKHCRIWV